MDIYTASHFIYPVRGGGCTAVYCVLYYEVSSFFPRIKLISRASCLCEVI